MPKQTLEQRYKAIGDKIFKQKAIEEAKKAKAKADADLKKLRSKK